MKPIKFSIEKHGEFFAFRIIKAQGNICLQIQSPVANEKWIASGAICHFANCGQAFNWAKEYANQGGAWHAANLANLIVFGAGQIDDRKVG